jgi:hypothetical protein
MCIICVELEKNKLTPWEAARNRREFLEILDDDHLEELNEKINQKLLEYLENLNDENSFQQKKQQQPTSK